MAGFSITSVIGTTSSTNTPLLQACTDAGERSNAIRSPNRSLFSQRAKNKLNLSTW